LTKLRDVYAQKALSQIPRLLSLQDRNRFSPTYGCFHRDYWLFKTSDFPDAVRQFGVHALALIYSNDMPDNIYFGNPKVRDWTIAGLDFWTQIQHSDGAFDEFYPYERGWVGPTAFTTYTVIETYRILKNEIHADLRQRILDAIKRSSLFIAAGEAEEDHLANHHAMACLAVWKAYELLDDNELRRGFEVLWKGFLRYHNVDEGWSREYDGVDPGYLSASVSFLAKIYENYSDPDILSVLRQSVEYCSYFVYPNNFYGGSLGSRNTLHFYPHGFELLADEIPLAAAIAEKMLQGLSEGKLVPPEIMSDRYVFYRVPEFILAYLDYQSRKDELPSLPYENEPFERYFSRARVSVINQRNYYVVANLAKGGVVKVFDKSNNRLVVNDCGILGRLEGGSVVTSQWIDPEFECEVNQHNWEVTGSLNEVPSNMLFTPFKIILFRTALVVLGWNPVFSHFLKGAIRKALMLGRRPVPIKFKRSFNFEDDSIVITDELCPEKSDLRIAGLSVGDEFFVRYVPQSRYFQSQELNIQGYSLDQSTLKLLNDGKTAIVRQVFPLSGEQYTEIVAK